MSAGCGVWGRRWGVFIDDPTGLCAGAGGGRSCLLEEFALVVGVFGGVLVEGGIEHDLDAEGRLADGVVQFAGDAVAFRGGCGLAFVAGDFAACGEEFFGQAGAFCDLMLQGAYGENDGEGDGRADQWAQEPGGGGVGSRPAGVPRNGEEGDEGEGCDAAGEWQRVEQREDQAPAVRAEGAGLPGHDGANRGDGDQQVEQGVDHPAQGCAQRCADRRGVPDGGGGVRGVHGSRVEGLGRGLPRLRVGSRGGAGQDSLVVPWASSTAVASICARALRNLFRFSSCAVTAS